MKIRYGFVSNSSTSSFLIAVDCKNYDTIKKAFWPGFSAEEKISCGYAETTVNEAVNFIVSALKHTKPLKEDKIEQFFSEHRTLHKGAKEKTERWIEQNKNKFTYSFCADDHSSEVELFVESGDWIPDNCDFAIYRNEH